MRRASFARARIRSSVARATDLLLAARRPLIAAGDGIFWSGAAPELLEFVELANIPVYTRRAGQGAVAEDHPLAVQEFMEEGGPFTRVGADVVFAIGFRFLERREVRRGAHLE